MCHFRFLLLILAIFQLNIFSIQLIIVFFILNDQSFLLRNDALVVILERLWVGIAYLLELRYVVFSVDEYFWVLESVAVVLLVDGCVSVVFICSLCSATRWRYRTQTSTFASIRHNPCLKITILLWNLFGHQLLRVVAIWTQRSFYFTVIQRLLWNYVLVFSAFGLFSESVNLNGTVKFLFSSDGCLFRVFWRIENGVGAFTSSVDFIWWILIVIQTWRSVRTAEFLPVWRRVMIR